MKGIIFNHLEAMVTDVYGPQAWDALLEHTCLQTKNGTYVGPKCYPDSDLLGLLSTASTHTGKTVDELVRTFGVYLFPALVERYPLFVKPNMTAKTFLMSVDQVIHVEVRKLHPDVALPTFEYEDPAPNKLVMTYRSRRMLCELAMGLIEGVGKHFGETIRLAQTRCLKLGDSGCRLECTFGDAA